jgi:VIT1/CCC1 family predicted Fe2+/Mn2+ transporter
VEKNEMEAPDDAVALDSTIVQEEVGPAETPDVFLAGVAEALKACADMDADLASILSDHLLTETPNSNAVANAKAAIVALAVKRAAPAEVQTDG